MGKATDFLNRRLKKREVVKPPAFTGSSEPIPETVKFKRPNQTPARPRVGKATQALALQQEEVKRPLKIERIAIQGLQLSTGDWFRAKGGPRWSGETDGETKTTSLGPEGPFQFIRAERHGGRLYLHCETQREGWALLYVGREPYTSTTLDSITVFPYKIRQKLRRPPRTAQSKKPSKKKGKK